MNFSEALEKAKQGHKIMREGWNGKGQWVCYMPSVTISQDLVNGRTRKFHTSGDLHVGGYFVIMTAQKVWQPGWLASQGDMLAEDWCSETVE